MLTIVLLLLGQATAAAPAPSLWEITMVSNGGEPVVHRACEAPLMTDESFLKGVDEMEPAGSRCEAPKLTRTADGWVRERTCREGADTGVIRASRKGDPATDATFTTEMGLAGRPPSWTLSTRYRRLGACPADRAEAVEVRPAR